MNEKQCHRDGCFSAATAEVQHKSGSGYIMSTLHYCDPCLRSLLADKTIERQGDNMVTYA